MNFISARLYSANNNTYIGNFFLKRWKVYVCWSVAILEFGRVETKVRTQSFFYNYFYVRCRRIDGYFP